VALPASLSSDGPLQLLGPLRDEPLGLRLPLAASTVAAGFPSPADDYIDVGIDLNETLIRHPSSTFFLRVSGDSMVDAGIQHGDLLVVDRSLEARPGHIVVAVLDGAFTLKRLARHQGRLRLEAANSAYPPLGTAPLRRRADLGCGDPRHSQPLHPWLMPSG